VAESGVEFNKNASVVEAVLKKYHRLYDIYYEYSGINNIKTINDNAGISPVKVDEEIISLIEYGKEVYALTAGELNIAMGAVLSIWHNTRSAASSGKVTLPSSATLAEAAKHTGIDDVIIDKKAGTVYLRDPLMSLDVGAIAKGYATERAAEELQALGVSGYALDIGGNIRLVGERDGADRLWTVGIRHPDGSGNVIKSVGISDTSLVTSGDYERFFIYNGEKYHHIIDKDTLMPSAYFSSVSVITRDSALADALTTALFAMPYEDGAALVESLEGVEAMWVTRDFTTFESDGFVALYR
jgi:thiamine biosynthesis lipoprotein